MIGTVLGALVATSVIANDLTIQPSGPVYAIEITNTGSSATSCPTSLNTPLDLGHINLGQSSGLYTVCITNIGTSTVFLAWTDRNTYNWRNQPYIGRPTTYCKIGSSCYEDNFKSSPPTIQIDPGQSSFYSTLKLFVTSSAQSDGGQTIGWTDTMQVYGDSSLGAVVASATFQVEYND